MPDIESIIVNFESLDDVLDKYEYLTELGRALEPLPPDAHCEANRVRGCASMVWLETRVAEGDPVDPVMTFRGDSDAKLVKGLVYLALCVYSGRRASEIAAEDARSLFQKLGLGGQVTAQRSNGFAEMLRRIRSDARRALADGGAQPSLAALH